MIRIVFLLLLFLTISFAAGGSIYFLYKMLINFQPGNDKIREDIKKMKEELEPWVKTLVPWNKEEMELLSLEQEEKKISKVFGTKIKGKYTSIYQEPLLAYAYHKYLSSQNALLYARTSKHEFIYRVTKKGVEIKINGEKVGRLTKKGILYGRKKRLIARINRGEDRLNPILVKDREIGSLVNSNFTKKVNPRAFEYLEKDISKEEESLFLSIALFDLIQNTNVT